MYQVLYRKWRPRTFAEIYGQDTVTAALRNELAEGHLAHAYLFTGSRGTGKTSCAKLLAKAVNCLHPHGAEPCNECEICRGIDDGSITDVTEIDAASNNGVDNIRDLRDEVAFAPAAAKYRVYIIDEVHMLSAGAFNALLKTLEEPPAHVLFILATTEAHKLPATILSRCQRFQFGRIAPEKIAERIAYIAGQEHFTVEPAAALLLARLADGGMRDALSLLDQCVAGGPDVTVASVSQTLGLVGRSYLYDLSACVRGQDGGGALALIDRLHNASVDMERLCVEWIEFYRHLLIARTVKEPAALIVAPPEEIARLRQEAAQYTPAALLQALTLLQQTLDRLRGGVSRRVEMEMAALRLCTPRLQTDPAGLAARIARLEEAFAAGVQPADLAPQTPQTPQTPPAPPEPAAEQAPAAPAAEAFAPPAAPPAEEAPPAAAPPQEFTAWPDVLARLAVSSPPLYGVLLDSRAQADREFLYVLTNNDLFRALVRQDNNLALLQQAVQAVVGRSYRIKVKRMAAEPAAAPENTMEAFLRRGAELGLPIEEKDG